MNKRGISPLIATVLIIGFTVALGAVVMTWGSSYIKDMQEQSAIKQAEAELKIQTSTDITDFLVKADGTADLVLENVGSKETESYLVRIEGENEEIDTIEINEGLATGDKKSFSVDFNYSKIGDVKSIEVIAQADLEGRTIKGATRSQEFTGAIDDSVLENGQMLWLKLDGNFLDSSGNGLDASEPIGYEPTLVNDGHSGQAYSFNGATQYVNLNTDPSLEVFDAPFTVSLWAKWTTDSCNTRAIFYYSYLTDLQIGTGGSTKEDQLSIVHTGTTPNYAGAVGPAGINDGEFHHLVVKYDGVDLILFVDGVSYGVTLTNYYNINGQSGRKLADGAYSCGSTTGDFEGTIDEVRVWNRALSTDEIIYLANN